MEFTEFAGLQAVSSFAQDVDYEAMDSIPQPAALARAP